MQFVGKVISSVSEFYRDINPSTLSGAIDVIVVEDVETNELACSPFHVRFGKLQLLRPQEKAVELRINGAAVDRELMMKVGEAGETFFVLSREELGGGEGDLPSEYLTSPLISPETPVPLEQIEEFKLKDVTNNSETSISSSSVNANNSVSTITNAITNVSPITSASASASENSLNVPTTANSNVKSPEWKWEWGDLPMKKKSEESVDDKDKSIISTSVSAITTTNIVNDATTATLNTTTTTTTNIIITADTITLTKVELYEYLCEKEYLEKCFEEGGFARFPPRSMICRIYRLDRGLYFHNPTTWPQELPQLLNESARLVESDFLLNPNVVIEDSSRLVYQFSWENKRVCFSGSVGAAIVFYAQTYARILPLEIVKKLAEIAALRLAKRKFSKSQLKEEGIDEEKGERMEKIDEENEKVDKADKIENEKIEDKVENEENESVISNNEVENGNDKVIKEDVKKTGGSSWRSWWSRSSTHNTQSKPNTQNVPITKSENSVTISQDIPLATTTTSTTTSVVPESPVRMASPGGSPKLVNKLEQLVVSAPPATLSALVNDSEIDKSPTKRIIQRTTSIGQLSTSLNDYDNKSTASTKQQISSTVQTQILQPASPAKNNSRQQQYIKSLRLPSHLLKRLNLKPGVNTITYTVNTRLQGTATCQSRIFLWRSDSRVVISDIDGTITKSDALGHLFTMVGKDWTHVGVAQLYSKIAANGYEFLYLTSRAIGQAASTRGYLKAVEQDRLQLPDGPVIMSPDRLFTALHREVIQRRPDEFKIACLRDIQKLFVPDEEEVSMMGSGVISSSEDEYGGIITRRKQQQQQRTESEKDRDNEGNFNNSVILSSKSPQASSQFSGSGKANPFYAGFGNRPTDTKSYKAVGISASRIFLINPAGDLKLDKLTFYTPYSASSYSKLTEEVDKVFPPVRSPSSLVRMAGDEAFTDFQYWHGQGGDVRMDLVQEALGSIMKKNGKNGKDGKNGITSNYTNYINNNSISTPVNILVDESGKPVSPMTLQMSLDEGEFYKLKRSEKDVKGAETVDKSGEEADSEAELDIESSDSDSNEVLESIDSFPFI